ncbi:hypothetical protein Misp01_02070 [Microtetraspora sp. NBRC 13810]|nr:hypothetical protein Misp01_02070 [Microtetraspora sp. NBRC 13810]
MRDDGLAAGLCLQGLLTGTEVHRAVQRSGSIEVRWAHTPILPHKRGPPYDAGGSEPEQLKQLAAARGAGDPYLASPPLAVRRLSLGGERRAGSRGPGTPVVRGAARKGSARNRAARKGAAQKRAGSA